MIPGDSYGYFAPSTAYGNYPGNEAGTNAPSTYNLNVGSADSIDYAGNHAPSNAASLNIAISNASGNNDGSTALGNNPWAARN
jgi:hypothetical protein